MSFVERAADFISEISSDAVPPLALRRAKQALIDYAGVTVAGSLEPVAKIITDFIRHSGSAGVATVIASDLQANVTDAALANGTIGHALDYDDSNFLLGGHPTVALYPAIFALGQKPGCGGSSMLDAYVIGFEVMMKIAERVNFAHYEKGWHPTATLGTFGAAAAAARLLKLPRREARMALGLAASMAAGIKANFGTMAKPLQVGHAGHKGLLCALLAAAGATSSGLAFEGRQGFLEVYNGTGRYKENDSASFGEHWELLASGLMFKKYACCGSTHPAIDAALELQEKHRIDPGDIRAAVIRINPRRLPHVDRPDAASALEGKFSLQYTVAAALTDRELGLRHFTDEAVRRSGIRELMAKIRAEPLPDAAESLSQACELTVVTKDGQTCRVRLETAKGRSAEDFAPYLRKKFIDCATQVFEADKADRLLSLLERVDQADNADDVIRQFSLNQGG